MTDEDFIREIADGNVTLTATGDRTWAIEMTGTRRVISDLLHGADEERHCYQAISWDFTEDGRGQMVEAVLIIRPAEDGMPGAVMTVEHTMAAGMADDYPPGTGEGTITLFGDDPEDERRAVAARLADYERMWAEPLIHDVRQRMSVLADASPATFSALGDAMASLQATMDDITRACAGAMENAR